MRKCLIIVSILLTACAGNQTVQQQTYIAPPELSYKYQSVVRSVVICMGVLVEYRIMDTQEPYASMNADGILTVSEGIVQWDDDALRLVVAHEIAHKKLHHVRNAQITSYAITGAMLVLNAFVPGAGYLNRLVNPVAVKAYSREQELEADKTASDECLRCFNTSVARQVEIFKYIKNATPDGGGFWDNHPSWDDRINNISTP